MVLKLQQNICIHFELCIILLRFQSILSMTKNISRVVVYTQSVSGYIPNKFLVKRLIPNYNLYYKLSMI